ncbi:hypothetical protein M2281_005791 [Mesorhizobium soli]|nr:hypothetical protein [Mesorhizobium soli]
MKRYLSTLACSGLMSIGASLHGAAFAATFPSSIPEIVPTVNAIGVAFRALPAQPVNSGIHGVLLHKQNDDPGGMQLVRGGGGGGGHGGGMGGGGSTGGGMGGSSTGGNSAGGSGIGGGGVGGGGFFGFGQYPRPYCNPYYGPCYPGYRRGY